MMENAKKMFSAEISEGVADEFLRHCEQRRYLKFGAIEGALKGFMVLPPELQVAIMSADEDADIYAILMEGLVDAEIARELDQLGPAADEFLRLLKQAKRTTSGKRKT